MEKEFGALKGLMGVNGLTGDGIMPDIGLAIISVEADCNDSMRGCKGGCQPGCTTCQPGCSSGKQNG